MQWEWSLPRSLHGYLPFLQRNENIFTGYILTLLLCDIICSTFLTCTVYKWKKITNFCCNSVCFDTVAYIIFVCRHCTGICIRLGATREFGVLNLLMANVSICIRYGMTLWGGRIHLDTVRVFLKWMAQQCIISPTKAVNTSS